jgi:hypothetical protein
MKQLRQRWPRRDEMLGTPFAPLSDADFRGLVADGSAIPMQRGNSLYVAKWIEGPGMEANLFLAALRAKGSTLEIRRHLKDVNIRVVPAHPSGTGREVSVSRRNRVIVPA